MTSRQKQDLAAAIEHLLYGERLTLLGGNDVRTRQIRELLAGPIGERLQPHEKEGLALALRDADADDATIALLVQMLYGKRGKKRPAKGR